MKRKRVPKGTRRGGQFAPDTSGKTQVPTTNKSASAFPATSNPFLNRLMKAKDKLFGSDAEFLASKNKHPLKFTLVSTDDGCDTTCRNYGKEHGDSWDRSNNGYWPHDITKTYLIEGELANRIRKRLGVSKKVPVHYIDTKVDDSYSEWTQQHYFAFELRVGDYTEDFNPKGIFEFTKSHTNALVMLLEWLQEDELGSEANSVARTLGSLDSFKERAKEYFQGLEKD